ncbi:MAG: DUF1318 domain-containing protein [Candidatus Binatia bacterium]
MLRLHDHAAPALTAGLPLSRLLLTTVCPAVFAMACVTVNIYFPAPEVREAAEQIVDETWGGPAAAVPGPQSGVAGRVLLAVVGSLLPAEAHAADVDVNVSTAGIRALKEGMKQRSGELKPFLASGGVGIGKDGLLVQRDAGAMDLATKARVRRLVDAENKDREALYREIASANKYGAERVADIRSIFAQTWKDKAERGWFVQGSDGSWKKK